MKAELVFKLVRLAKKSGGDRYECGVERTPEHIVLYIPQMYSRLKGVPLPKLRITIAHIEE